jgi:hypothetical protein
MDIFLDTPIKFKCLLSMLLKVHGVEKDGHQFANNTKYEAENDIAYCLIQVFSSTDVNPSHTKGI